MIVQEGGWGYHHPAHIYPSILILGTIYIWVEDTSLTFIANGIELGYIVVGNWS
jgi:hypothetical protein